MELQMSPIAHDDTIDILKFFHSLWQEKLIIIVVTAASFLMSLAYISFAKPVYQLQVRISPPIAEHVRALNYSRMSSDGLLQPFDTNAIYGLLIKSLLAESTKYNFFNTVYRSYFPDTKHKSNTTELYAQYLRSMIISEIPRTQPAQYTITVRGHSAEQLPIWLNDYINFVKKQAEEQLHNVVTLERENILYALQQQMDIAKDNIVRRKLHRLSQLKEALKIAEAAKLESPAQAGFSAGVIIKEADLYEPNLMYSRGIKALNAEIKNFINHNPDELSSIKLRQLQSRYDFYKKPIINIENFPLFSQDGVFIVPHQPISPKKSLIIPLFLILGFLGGIFIVIVQNFFRVKF